METPLSDKLRAAAPTPSDQPTRSGPLWKGPEEDGITFSLLSRFLVCRERFRLLVVEGLRPADTFSSRLEFGQMWHVCEQAHASHDVVAAKGPTGKILADNLWVAKLQDYARSLCNKYRLQQQEISHWYEMVKALFPVYADYWSKHPDVTSRTPLLQEQTFNVPYKLPSGRAVRLRGKWDAVDLIGSGKSAGIYLQENKSKSSIDTRKLSRQLTFDLQTMLYLVALREQQSLLRPSANRFGKEGWVDRGEIRGVRYNVVRRSSHKTPESMLKKIHEDIAAGRGGEWFARWKVEVTRADLNKFRQQCLDPILEQLCQWWEWIEGQKYSDLMFQADDGIHWRHPYGVWNVLDEGGTSDLDNYIDTGSEVGLQRTDNLFRELTDV